MTVSDREGLANLYRLLKESIRSILVVEADRSSAAPISEAIEQAFGNATVRTAATGKQCRAELKGTTYDCILLDQEAPDTDGIELIGLIAKEYPYVPVVALADDVSFATQAMRRGAAGYILRNETQGDLGLLPEVIQRAVELARRRASAEDSNRVFGEAQLMTFEIGPEGGLLWANRAGLEHLGYTLEQFQALNIRDLVPEYEWKWMNRCLERVRDASAAATESALLTKEGQCVDVLINATIVPDPSGRVVKIRVFMNDIARVRQLEEQLFQSQKMASIGALAAGVAHDFNNILATILLASQMINMEVGTDCVLKRQAQNIQSGAESGAELASQLLSFAGADRRQSRTVEPNSLVKEIVSLSRPSISNSISIELKLDPKVRHILADRNQIAQVVLNLALNARDAMPKGGTLTFATENFQVTDDELCRKVGIQKGEYVRISVTDTGSGIDERVLGKIFDPFFTTKDAKRGTGLGLSIARGIIEKHNGGIEVRSSPNEGASFFLYIPSSHEPETVETDEDDLEALCGTEHVLVVEDRDQVRESVSQMLSLWGYTVTNAPDGPSAIEAYQQHNSEIDAVFMDLRMPGMDGIETYGQLKKIDDSVLVVLTSGYGHEKLVAKASRQGVAGFIKKPYKIEQLLSLLRQLLDETKVPAATLRSS